MAQASLNDILKIAQQLSPEDRMELADALIHGSEPTSSDELANNNLLPLVGLTVDELQILAHSVVASEQQGKLKALLEKNRDETLSADEEATLAKLLAEADRLALLKARAMYTLKILGVAVDE